MTVPKTFSRRRVFRAALTMARRYGVDRMSKRHVADHLGCAMGTVNFHWKTMAALREAIIARAHEKNDTALFTGALKRK